MLSLQINKMLMFLVHLAISTSLVGLFGTLSGAGVAEDVVDNRVCNVGQCIRLGPSDNGAVTPESMAAMPTIPTSSDRRFIIQEVNIAGVSGESKLIDVKIANAQNVRVVDMFQGIKVSGYRTYSLSEVLTVDNPPLAVSGPASVSLTLPSALGLVVDNGRTASNIDRSSAFAKGVLCINSSGQPSIAYASKVNTAACRQAMQSGPLIIEPNYKIGIRPSELTRAASEHIIVAVDGQSKLHILMCTPLHLYDLAKYLHDQHFMSALNVSTGLDHSALVIHAGNVNFQYGNPEGSVPSALILSR